MSRKLETSDKKGEKGSKPVVHRDMGSDFNPARTALGLEAMRLLELFHKKCFPDKVCHPAEDPSSVSCGLGCPRNRETGECLIGPFSDCFPENYYHIPPLTTEPKTPHSIYYRGRFGTKPMCSKKTGTNGKVIMKTSCEECCKLALPYFTDAMDYHDQYLREITFRRLLKRYVPGLNVMNLSVTSLKVLSKIKEAQAPEIKDIVSFMMARSAFEGSLLDAQTMTPNKDRKYDGPSQETCVIYWEDPENNTLVKMKPKTTHSRSLPTTPLSNQYLTRVTKIEDAGVGDQRGRDQSFPMPPAEAMQNLTNTRAIMTKNKTIEALNLSTKSYKEIFLDDENVKTQKVPEYVQEMQRKRISIGKKLGTPAPSMSKMKLLRQHVNNASRGSNQSLMPAQAPNPRIVIPMYLPWIRQIPISSRNYAKTMKLHRKLTAEIDHGRKIKSIHNKPEPMKLRDCSPFPILTRLRSAENSNSPVANNPIPSKLPTALPNDPTTTRKSVRDQIIAESYAKVYNERILLKGRTFRSRSPDRICTSNMKFLLKASPQIVPKPSSKGNDKKLFPLTK